MTPEDFRFAVRLTDTVNWKLAEEDFKFMTALEPKGCFTLLENSEKIGIVTTISFGRVGWFGNLIVAKEHRKKGAGTLLAKHGINYLANQSVKTVGLYAYIDKIPFYRRLGFQYQSEFTVLDGTGFSSTPTSSTRESMKEDLDQIFEMDQACFGATRRKVLEHIFANRSNSCHVAIEDGRMIGYAAAKVYEDMAELGPLVVAQGHNNVAVDLLKANLNGLRGLKVSLCVPTNESYIIGMLMKAGFKESFRVARMFFRHWTAKDCIYAAESLERG